MNGMSEREYSTHAGLSRGAVQNAKRGGRLVFYAILLRQITDSAFSEASHAA